MQTIPLARLALALAPVLVVLVILQRWRLQPGNTVYGLFRMLVQLLLIGYVLVYLFEAQSPWPILAVLLLMVTASSWIALRSQQLPVRQLLPKAMLAIGGGGGIVLVTVVFGVLNLEPWFQPRYMIPLAGMIFANAMNSVSLAGERFGAELSRGESYEVARSTALRAALIPITNSLFAVGLVSLPGMMTGQILSGVSPMIAARYQLMVMCMIYAAAGISAALYLKWMNPVSNKSNASNKSDFGKSASA